MSTILVVNAVLRVLIFLKGLFLKEQCRIFAAAKSKSNGIF